jgi:hypothetical protein
MMIPNLILVQELLSITHNNVAANKNLHKSACRFVFQVSLRSRIRQINSCCRG